jgi:hypothetical protein
VDATATSATIGGTAPLAEVDEAPVLRASGIEKSYRRGVWPVRRSTAVLRGADLTLRRGEVDCWRPESRRPPCSRWPPAPASGSRGG